MPGSARPSSRRASHRQAMLTSFVSGASNQPRTIGRLWRSGGAGMRTSANKTVAR
jgi:hypothetical protein